MPDDIENLKDTFRAAPALPRPAAKQQALERAMAAFDQKNAPASQGARLQGRLMEAATAVFQMLFGRRPMNVKMNHALAGGASLAVLVLAVVSVTYVRTGDFGGLPSARDEVKPVAPAVAPGDSSKEDRGRAVFTRENNRLAHAPKIEGAAEQAAPQPPQTAAVEALRLAPREAPGRTELERQSMSARRAPDPSGRVAAMPSQALPDRPAASVYQDQGRDRFEKLTSNPIKVTREEPVSTFSIDVDTASYTFVRASLNNNTLPQKDAVRVEELVNYFPYNYERPHDRVTPFKSNVSVFPSPWNAGRKLVHIGIAGFELPAADKPKSNLVFLIDTSGSMNAPNKLPLAINAMKLLLGELKPDDTVAIVTYAGSAGTALEPTLVKEKAKILQALDNLRSRGSTAGAEGIRQAYELARRNFDGKGVNRVILATDGDFNVGITDREELKSYVERQRETGISLSVLGFGRGNYNDALMQTLAQNGNGNAAYIDTLNEARKVLVEQASSMLFTIAKDVKLQLEFNPATVSEYRLIGYETRLLKRDDFNNDKVDAGDIGAGHTVTALYEITPAGSDAKLVNPLRYGTAQQQSAPDGAADEYGYLKVRYKLPGEDKSKLITTPITRADEASSVDAAPNEARFAASVAAFGQILRGGRYTGSFGYDDVIALAQGAKGKDEFGYRAEFINLARLAKSAAAMEPQPRR
jgi:Ca-activated chloride channel family protein